MAVRVRMAVVYQVGIFMHRVISLLQSFNPQANLVMMLKLVSRLSHVPVLNLVSSICLQTALLVLISLDGCAGWCLLLQAYPMPAQVHTAVVLPHLVSTQVRYATARMP